ncbi:glycosyltransferase family 4 protein [Cellulomonas sp. RIT-PI-Y]|uniref:glycosyltransferase family 4 protein n=1 Tax=Cellulomonas sp. RIT-PI-Y TaxID=3035297 RepID=UPI0021D7ED62|nr:glycosyltransferase family 4 protein [Cellulomonas sp. RIT-PI-Y]
MTAPDVVHVVCTEEFAGVERYVSTLARVQDQRGARVLVFGGDPARMPAELAGTGVGWHPAATWRQARSGLRGLTPGVVHAHMTAAELAAVLAGRAPVVATRHFAERRGSSLPARTVGRFLTARIAAQVAISSFVAERVEGASVVAHPGVPAVPESGVAREQVVLIAQRLEAEKRTDLGLRIWAASGLGSRGWTLQIAGTGALRPELETMARRLGVGDSVRFLGARSDVGALLSRAGILFAPRPDEPYGLSVVEAMAHGVPVVAGSGGGHTETVGSVPGAVLVPADDLATAGRMLAALADDPARRAAYGAALRAAQQERFDLSGHADAVAAVYAEVRR